MPIVIMYKGRRLEFQHIPSSQDIQDAYNALYGTIPSASLRDFYELSAMQRRIWFLEQLDPGNAFYNLSTALHIHGHLDNDALRFALQAIVNRHSVLRTVFQIIDGHPVQIIQSALQLFCPCTDLTHLSPEQQEQVCSHILLDEAKRGFDLATGPLLRTHIVKKSEEQGLFVLTIHHMIIDGWSLGVFMDELRQWYTSYLQGKRDAPSLQAPALQFVDYAEWHSQRMQQPDFQKHRDYWMHQLQAPLPILDLPTDRPRTATTTHRGALLEEQLTSEFTARVKQFAQKHNTTPFAVLMSIFQVLLHRYSGQTDLIIGMPVAARSRQQFEHAIGPFMNSLPLRVKIRGDLPFQSVLAQVTEKVLAAYTHQEYPLDHILIDLRSIREVNRSPLYSVDFAFQNAPLALELPDVSISPAKRYSPYTVLDLMLTVTEFESRFTFEYVYNTDLFFDTTIQRMMTHFQQLLQSALVQPERNISQMEMLTQEERYLLLEGFNKSVVLSSPTRCMHEMFEEQAHRIPDHPALIFEDQQFTYGDLNARANQIARMLMQRGLSQGSLVGLLVHRCFDAYACILGILKIGAAYLPLDPTVPPQRLQALLDDAQPSLVITSSNVLSTAIQYTGNFLFLDQDQAEILAEECTNVDRHCTPENLAYVMYTSGSTGAPKGVLVTHRGLYYSVAHEAHVLHISPEYRILQYAAFTFDVSALEIFLALTRGATLVTASAMTLLDPLELTHILDQHRVTMMTLTPTVLAQLPIGAGCALQSVTVGGEACPPALAARWAQRVAFFNCYGATEAPNDVSIWPVPPEYTETSLPIGYPMPTTSLYILDEQLHLVPLGLAGEMYLGGDGLAYGYLHRADLTAERFVPDPFARQPGQRLYRTGDIGRYLEDGKIEVKGRIDDQVKIRGQRIELGEIEQTITALTGVTDVVVVLDTTHNDEQLIAYIVAESFVTIQSIKEQLKQRLPAVMVPAHVLFLDQLPLTPHGKVDRRALPVPSALAKELSSTPMHPRSEVEQTIAQIWSEVLHCETIGRNENFFDLGGHSFALVNVHHLLKERLHITNPLTDLFKYPTIQALAEALTETPDDPRSQQTFVGSKKGRTGSDERTIAVIGIALRFPQADTPDEFWHHLRQGMDGISHLEDAELEPFILNQDPTLRTHLVKAGGYLDHIDTFDAAFFGLSDRQARWTDPQARLFLTCAWEAIEDAGYSVRQLPSATGLYAGCNTNRYITDDILRTQTLADAFEVTTRTSSSFLVNQVAYLLDLHGECMDVDTACSTGLAAIHLSVQSLREGRLDMALAGAANINVPQKTGYIYQEGLINSPDGVCRAFDKDAAGTVSGNGVGVVVLKRLSDALRDHDPIYALISGTATNNDGHRKVGFSAPSIQGQVAVIQSALADANIDPSAISYIETHGTGTKLGDHIELAALAEVFKEVPEPQCCAIGSVKTNIGHLDTAAGIAGFIKAVLALHHHEIPPSLHFTEPSPQIDLTHSAVFVNTVLRPWEQREKCPLRAGVSSFGIGGTNVHIVLEEAPQAVRPRMEGRSHELITLSARTPAALTQMVRRLAAYAENHTEDLTQIAHTLHVSRAEFEHRLTYSVQSTSELITAAQTFGMQPVSHSSFGHDTKAQSETVQGVFFLFTGQGSQYPGMARDLYQFSQVFRACFDQCAEILDTELDEPLKSIVWEHASESALLDETHRTQPALFAIEYSLAQLWISWGIRPAAVMGHSLGEYVAACIAGVISLPDALRLVTRRGRLMKDLCSKGAMMAVWTSLERITASLQPYAHEVSIAALNGAEHVVISGDEHVLQHLALEWEKLHVRHRILQVSHAFHSPLMEPMLAPFRDELQRIQLHAPRLPLISNLTGTWVTEEQITTPEYWLRHLREPVQFATGIRQAADTGYNIWLEIGPQPVLSRLASAFLQDQNHLFLGSLKKGSPDWQCVMDALGHLWEHGIKVNWSAVDEGEVYTRAHCPTYPFEQKSHWLDIDRSLCQPSSFLPNQVEAKPDQDHGAEEEVAEIYQMRPLEHLEHIWCDVLGISASVPDTSFFDIGGDSLSVVQLLSRIRQDLGIDISLEAFFAAPTLAYLQTQWEHQTVVQKPMIVRRGVQDFYPLSHTQKRMWFLAQFEPGSPYYNMPSAVKLEGPLDLALFQQALHILVERHEMLRTTFSTIDGLPVQKIHEHVSPTCVIHDWSGWDHQTQDAHYHQMAIHDINTPFDLVHGPLFRLQLFQFGPTEHVFLMTQHHIIGDVWSSGIFVRELSQLYTALQAKQEAHLSLLPVRYVDYALWQESQQYQRELSEHRHYWHSRFAEEPPVLALPTDHPRPSRPSFKGAMYTATLDADVLAQLKHFCDEWSVTPFMVLIALFNILLYYYTGQDDIVIGTPVAGRERVEFEPIIGLFVNTVMLRTTLDHTFTLTQLLAQIKQETIAALAHQSYPFELLVEELRPKRDLTRTPLFSVMFVYQDARLATELGNLRLTSLRESDQVAKFDLTLTAAASPDALELDFTYMTELFHSQTIIQMMERYCLLLKTALQHPQSPLSMWPLFDTLEPVTSPITRMNSVYGQNYHICIHELFEAQVAASPTIPAICMGEISWTYEAFNAYANQIAHTLRDCGVQAETIVAILLERSPEAFASILGVLKAGGAYLPLDVAYPVDRLAMMLDDAQPYVLVTCERFLPLCPHFQGTILNLDAEREHIAQAQQTNLPTSSVSENLAYIIYTSGSTGRPKGTGLTHRGIGNLAQLLQRTYAIQTQDRMLQFASLSFDASVAEWITALTVGATLIIAPQDVVRDPQALTKLMQKEQVAVAILPPTLLAELTPTALPHLRTVTVAGEACPPILAKIWSSHLQLLNAYGPTEATVCASIGPVPVEAAAWSYVPTGPAVDHVELYILDEHLSLVPTGASGEVYIGGLGLARGYLKRSDLTAERFIPHPFAHTPGERLYRTGDRGRILSDGQLEILGRVDRQIKIRGYRIEIGEVEVVLATCPSVRTCAVVVIAKETQQPYLVAFVVLDTQASQADVRGYLRSRLPDFMVPAHIVLLETLPMNANGKVDYSALAHLWSEQRELHQESATERSPLEQTITRIWCDALDVPSVGLQQDFFEVGGHSLKAAQVAARLSQQFRLEVPVRLVFEAPTVAGLATALEQLLMEMKTEMLQLPSASPERELLELSPNQQVIWEIQQHTGEQAFLVLPYAVRLHGTIDHDILEMAVQSLVEHQAVLRTRIVSGDDKIHQFFESACVAQLPFLDLSAYDDAHRQREIEQVITSQMLLPFDLSNGPLFRFQMLRLAAEEHLLLCSCHRLITDGWSVQLLIQELTTRYVAMQQKRDLLLPPLRYSYGDYIQQQQAALHTERLQRQRAFWLATFEQHGLPTLHWPVQKIETAEVICHTLAETLQLSAAQTSHLRAVAQQQKVTLFVVLLAVLQVVLIRLSGQDDFVIWTPTSGRVRMEYEEIIGHFVNVLPIATAIDKNALNAPFVQTLAPTKHAVLEALDNQEYPYGLLLQALGCRLGSRWSEGLTVLFDLQQQQTFNTISGLTIQPLDVSQPLANFDLSFMVLESQEQLAIEIRANDQIFPTERLQQICDELKRLLHTISPPSPEEHLPAPLSIELVGFDFQQQEQLKRLLQRRWDGYQSVGELVLTIPPSQEDQPLVRVTCQTAQQAHLLISMIPENLNIELHMSRAPVILPYQRRALERSKEARSV